MLYRGLSVHATREANQVGLAGGSRTALNGSHLHNGSAAARRPCPHLQVFNHALVIQQPRAGIVVTACQQTECGHPGGPEWWG